jgi:Xaa-Pro aminopeptidase
MLERFTLKSDRLILVPAGQVLRDLIGVDQRDAILWIRGEEKILFGEGLTEKERLWGERTDTEVLAKQHSLRLLGAAEFDGEFNKLSTTITEVLLPFSDLNFLSRVAALQSGTKRFRRSEASISDLRPYLGSIKLIKSAAEVELLRAAGRKSAEAHLELLKTSWIDREEREMSRRFSVELLKREIDSNAYESIVASGERSLILHGRASEKKMRAGEIVLVDAAGKWKDFCSDITRTWPVGAKFTTGQKKLYEIVLSAQKIVLKNVHPGVTLGDLHRLARAELQQGLKRQGWMKDSEEHLLDLWFPHNTCHWLGRDVHDACPYFEADGSEIKLREGMVFTVEPGLYMRGSEAPEEVRGQGVRIEDDVVVTKAGCEILTSLAPKEIEEIESLRGEFA